ncbi:SDR family NAD(P)-dependent oxidoreductase [Motiliproteus coralliicola]|nr:SDR family NAD(P)-dependent oxidoreductase [Motiliproteus coralliicola]
MKPLSAPKRAFITGAGSGIGADVAKRLDSIGIELIISGSNSDKLRALAAELNQQPTIEVADLNDRGQVQRLCVKLKSDYEGLDIVFINAGVVEIGSFIERDDDAIDREIEINLRAGLQLIHACLPGMVQRQQGHILATSSVGGVLALKGSSVYSATKFALRGFLSALQQEVIGDGIKVSGIYPGAIDTNMLRHEATHGGSALNFLNEPKKVSDVGEAFMKALKTGKLETYIPYSDSISARLLGVIPWVVPRLLPLLEKIGERGRDRFIKSRGLKTNR